ncbi:tetratricopeptide repeat protein [Chloroherpeton thalassium]|uniref:tetratricopeptide repeat protein n=1 Tax=Chloroherpeton thalassium TaxID=100716 RepID=UPI00145EF031|nr:tetratricopeptide repeat protein [Chloroherpeton thalassium]
MPNRNAVLPKEVASGMELLRQARLNARMNQQEIACLNAEKAYQYFVLADDLEGIFYANLELAKLRRKSNPEESLAYLQSAGKIAEVFKPALRPVYQLRLAELKFLENDFAQTLSLMKNLEFDEESDIFASEALAYKIMATLKLKMGANKESVREAAKNLQRLYQRLKDRYDDYELKDPESISFSAYVLGLVAASEKSWSEAEKWFLAAWEIDRQISNYNGTAENLYSLGVVNRSLGNHAAALGFFERAARIFEILKNADRLAACKAQLQALPE